MAPMRLIEFHWMRDPHGCIITVEKGGQEYSEEYIKEEARKWVSEMWNIDIHHLILNRRVICFPTTFLLKRWAISLKYLRNAALNWHHSYPECAP